jgi:hypothetical protein
MSLHNGLKEPTSWSGLCIVSRSADMKTMALRTLEWAVARFRSGTRTFSQRNPL